jgi:hypothetical protein
MSLISSAHSAQPLAWEDVLEKVEDTLAKAEKEAARREEALLKGARSPENPDENEVIRQRFAQQLEARLRNLHFSLQQAEKKATEADGHLGSAEALVRQWRATALGVSARLNDGIRRAAKMTASSPSSG